METFLRHSVYTRCDPEYLCDLLRHISTESGDVPATETWKPTTTTTKATSKVWSKRRRSSSDDILHCWDDDRPQPLNSKHDLPLCNCAPFGKIYFIVRTAPAECRKARPISCRSRGQPCVSFLKFEAYNRRWESRVLTVAVSAIILTARSELREVLFWRCLWPFCLCMKYIGNFWTDLCQIDREDVIGPSFGRVWRSRSKVKGQRSRLPGTKTAFSALSSSVWMWRKSVQRFRRHFIHKQKTTDWRRQKQNLQQFTACGKTLDACVQRKVRNRVRAINFLWPPYGIGQAIIFFALWFLLLSIFIFIPRLISAVADWMFVILPHMVWP